MGEEVYKPELSAKKISLRIAIIYILTAGAYIILSDRLLARLPFNTSVLSRLQTEKGIMFVLTTGVLLYFILLVYLRKLVKSQKRLQMQIKRMPIAHILWTPEGKVVTWNPAAEKIFGFTAGEMLGKKPYGSIVPEESQSEIDRIWHSLFERGSSGHNVSKNITKDGRTITCEWYNTPLKSDDGKLIGVLSMVVDITERKQREEELRVHNERLTTLYTISRDMRTVHNTDELISVLVNKVFQLCYTDNVMIALLSSDHKKFNIIQAAGLFKPLMHTSFPSNQALINKVRKTKKTYKSEDFSTKTNVLFPELKGKIGPVIFVPLKCEKETLLGVIVIARPNDQQTTSFSDKVVDFLSTIGEMTGNALRRQQLYEELQKRLSYAESLRNIDMAITGSVGLRVTFRVILDEIINQLPVDAAAVLRFNPHMQNLTYETSRGFKFSNPKDTTLRMGEGYAGQAAQAKEKICIEDLNKIDKDSVYKELMEKEGFVSYCAVPLVIKGYVQGVLEVFSRTPLHRGGEWEEFLETLAGQASIAIDNAELFNNLKNSNIRLIQAYNATIEGWAYALDLKDEETERHTQRVTEMTLCLARKAGMNEGELSHAKRGALLHDIGKMGIPDSILLKPGKLNEEEWKVMRKHPVLAFQMLSPIEYMRPAVDIPYCHHEKWDGTGYPRGLQGEQIPLAARIFAVVDVWDALISDRPYRKAWTKEKTLEHIKEQKGKHFDPRIVDLFLQVKDECPE